MWSGCDRLGFPLLRLPRRSFRFHLLPVTKAQFEQYLAEPGGWGDAWYADILAVAPRASWRSFRPEDRERVFMTGVLPDEAMRYALWMGPAFDLPNEAEWRDTFRELNRSAATLADIDRRGWSPIALQIADSICDQLGTDRLADVALLRQRMGLVEWTRGKRVWRGLGSPRHEFWPNLWNPLGSDHVKDEGTRLKYVGFRLIERAAQ